MKKWQIQNSETSEISEISEILFRVFLFPSFRFCAIAKIKNSDLKISEKKFPNFPSFRPGPVDSDVSCFHGLFPSRSSHRGVLSKKGVLRNFTIFTGKYMCQSLFFNKFAGLGPASLLKKRLQHRSFSCGFCEISKNIFSTEHLWTTASVHSTCLAGFWIRFWIEIFVFLNTTE